MSRKYQLTIVKAWERAFSSKHGPHATTRHVLHALALYMGDDGKCSTLSTATISDICGLSERTVCTHLERARADGWLMSYGQPNKPWECHTHYAQIPEAVAVTLNYNVQQVAMKAAIKEGGKHE